MPALVRASHQELKVADLDHEPYIKLGLQCLRLQGTRERVRGQTRPASALESVRIAKREKRALTVCVRQAICAQQRRPHVAMSLSDASE